jgi:hypothetical protein
MAANYLPIRASRHPTLLVCFSILRTYIISMLTSKEEMGVEQWLALARVCGDAFVDLYFVVLNVC